MNIKKIIRQRGYTLASVAAQMPNRDGSRGISQPALTNIINGNPTIDRLQEIANIIDVPLSVLVADDAQEEQTTTIKCPFCGAQMLVKVGKGGTTEK